MANYISIKQYQSDQEYKSILLISQNEWHSLQLCAAFSLFHLIVLVHQPVWLSPAGSH